METTRSRVESVKLSEIPSDYADDTDELSPPQKARFKMTYWVLFGSAFMFACSGAAYIFSSNGVIEFANDIRTLCTQTDNPNLTLFCQKYMAQEFQFRNTAAREVFEFCKNFIPPIVTLVLGAHYVNKSIDQD